MTAALQPADEPEVVFRAYPKQAAYIRAALGGTYTRLCYGGGIRGGKTIAALNLIFALCRIYPGSRWAIVRRDLPTLRRNVLPAFNKFRPTSFVGRFHKDDWVARCANGSEILLFPEGITDDPELERWKGLEVNGFLLEEGPELHVRSWYKAIERAGSWRLATGPQPPPLILVTCNPAPGWVKETFYDPWRAGRLKAPYFFVPATVDDNPAVAVDPETGEWTPYRQSLETLPERERQRFVYGDWSGVEEVLLFGELEERRHLVDAAPPRPETRKIAVADWGWTAPAPVGWFETDSGYYTGGLPFSRLYREWWPTHTVPETWAAEVLRQSAIVDDQGDLIGFEIDEVVIDSATKARGQDGAPSVFEQLLPVFRLAGVKLTPSNKVAGPEGKGFLYHSTMLLHTYLDTGGGKWPPLLTISRACPRFWKELTTIRRGRPDIKVGENADVEAPHQENHATAVCRYFVGSRPKPAALTPAQRQALDVLWQQHRDNPMTLEAARQERARQAGVPLARVSDLVIEERKPRKRRPWERRRR